MRNFINKKAKNVKSDRFHRTSVIIDNKVKVEEVKPEVVNVEMISNPEEIVEKMIITTPIESTDELVNVVKEQPKPKRKKNVKIENKETKIED